MKYVANFFSEIRKMLTSGDNEKISSKRLITFLAFILVSMAFLVNLFWGYSVDPNMFDGMIQIVWAGLGVVVGEHLLKVRHHRRDGHPFRDDVPHPEEYPDGYPENNPDDRHPDKEGELGDN
jgi:hypothetical protein